MPQGQSRSVTWMPRGVSTQHRCWRTLQLKQWDVVTVHFLLKDALKKFKEGEDLEEEEERRWMEQVKAMSELSPPSPAQEEEEEEVSTSSWCADSTMRARVLLSLFVWCSVFPLVVYRPEMPHIMAGMYQMDSSSLIVVYGSGSCKVGFPCDNAPRSVFPSVDDRPKMLDIMAGTDQKNSFVVIGGMIGWCCW